MLSLSAGRIKAASLSRDRLLTITETLYSKTNDMIATALAGHHSLTREALGQVLQQRGVAVDRARLVHFLMRAEVEGIVCSGPRQGKAHTFALLDERVPMTAPLLREEALCRLAYIYFSSHCPATVQDFAWWSGLSQTEARQGLEGVKGDFFAEDIGGRTYWIANALATVAKAKASALLLPAFDEYIISYRDRTDVLTPEHQRLAVTSNGIFRPTLVENGLVTGLWHKQAKHTPSFDYFDAPADPVLLREAVAAYKAFC
jgi:hypothetical protein